MAKKLAAFVLCFGLTLHFSASADDTLVKFKGGIGVIPVSAGVGAAATAEVVNRNIVRGVQPPGQIWRIGDLQATIRNDGRISVRGKGLLLAGGNAIGGNAGQTVVATLICEATAPFTLRSTSATGVPLQPNGDFQIDDVLTPAPSGCASPVLLIRNLAGAWFAAGLEDLGD
jgi:hypothetical protein